MENTITVTLNKEQHAKLRQLAHAALFNALRMNDPKNQFSDFNQEENDARIKVCAELNKLLTWGEK